MKRRTFIGIMGTGVGVLLSSWAVPVLAAQLYYSNLTESQYLNMTEAEYLGMLEFQTGVSPLSVGAGSSLQIKSGSSLGVKQ